MTTWRCETCFDTGTIDQGGSEVACMDCPTLYRPFSYRPGGMTALDTIEALRALEGRKVKIQYQAVTPRFGFDNEVGTIVRDDRVPSLERYLVEKRRSAHVLYPREGLFLVKVYGEQV